MQSNFVATSNSRTWSQGMNKNAKTCFLEDLEEMPGKTKESFSPKSRFENNDNNQKFKNLTQNNATMTEGHITRSTFSASTPNIYSSSSSSAVKRDMRSIHNGEQNIDAASFFMDSAATDVKNVGGAAKFHSGKDSSDFRVSLRSRGTDNIFSHSIGTLNSLNNYPPSLSRKIHTSSSSNSMSSLDAVTSSKTLLRDNSKTINSLKEERNSAPVRKPSFNNGGATNQTVAIASPAAAAAAIDASSNLAEQRSLANDSFTTAASTLSIGDFCKICHCGSEINQPLIAPCFCSGSLKFVHQECLQKWIKSSDIKRCELCKYPFDMQAKVKPFCQWEKLDMSSLEKRKLFCSVTFHMVAITCVVWSLYVLIDRTAEEVRQGDLAWPFWTKLVVVAIGFTGGLVFMYIQCKVYVHLCRKWKAYNRIIVVQDAPEGIHKAKLDDAKDKDASALVSYSSSNSNNNDLHSGSIHIEDSRRNSNVVGSGASSFQPVPMETESRMLNESNKQPHFNDQESPIDCDDGDIASTSNITRTTTIATVNSSLPSGSSHDNNLPSKSSKTNAETQTALRGVSLMEMIQRSTTTGTVDDIENGKCRNGKCDVQVPSGANQVKVVTVSNILDEMQTHSLNDVSVGNNDNGNMVQGAAIFFTECECKKKQSSNEVKESLIENDSTTQQSVSSKEEQTFKLPGSPVEDLTDSVVKTENTLPINVSNTIVSPLTQKRGSK